jgi:cell division protease FtsH
MNGAGANDFGDHTMSNPRLSGTMRRNSPMRRAAQSAGAAANAAVRTFARDPLSAFLLAASVALAIAFFALLSSLRPQAQGQQVALTNITSLASAQRIRSAVLLDHDHQVVAQTDTGLQIYADYPSSDAATLEVFNILRKGGAEVSVNPQSSKPARQIVVQFLIPILLLVCLFAFFTRQTREGSGGIASFSSFRGKGNRRKRGSNAPITFDSVAGAGEAVAELREIRDFLEDPSRYLEAGAAAPTGVLFVGPCHRRRGRRRLLFRLRRGVRRVAGGCRRGADP